MAAIDTVRKYIVLGHGIGFVKWRVWNTVGDIMVDWSASISHIYPLVRPAIPGYYYLRISRRLKFSPLCRDEETNGKISEYSWTRLSKKDFGLYSTYTCIIIYCGLIPGLAKKRFFEKKTKKTVFFV